MSGFTAISIDTFTGHCDMPVSEGSILMVLVEQYCRTCGTAYTVAEGACAVCGASLKITRPLHEETADLLPALTLTHHLHANQLFQKRYRILRQVGAGGFGAVYEAEDTQEQRRVAIKELSLAGLTSQQVAEATNSFHREAELLSRLRHPGIPRMYDQVRESEHWYLVMDFIEGQTLEAYLAQMPGGRLPLGQALQIALQICDVLECLHTHQPKVIFRDLKPTNLMLTPDQQIKVIDFGVARFYKPGKPKDTIAFGSPGYAAPEQYGRSQTTPRSDIYSLGALLHQMLTGQDPSLSLFRFQPLRAADRDLPVNLEKLVARMLDMRLTRRPGTIEAVRQRLQSIADSLLELATPQDNANLPAASVYPQPFYASAATPVRAFSTLGVTVAIFRQHTAPIKALAWSPDGLTIVSCDARAGGVFMWNAFHPSDFYRLPLWGGAKGMSDLAWSPDGQTLAAACGKRMVRYWRVDAHPTWWQMMLIAVGLRVRSYKGHTRSVHALCWSPDGQMIASGEKPPASFPRAFAAPKTSSIHVWDTRNKQCLLRYVNHSHAVEDVAWAPNGRCIASCSLDHSVRIWDANSGSDRWIWETKRAGLVHTLAWSRDARYLACGTGRGNMHVWDTLREHQVYICRGHQGAINSVAWSRDGQRIASAGSDGTVRIWRAQDGQNLFVYRSYEGGSVLTVGWSPDGQHIASAGQGGDVRVWRAV